MRAPRARLRLGSGSSPAASGDNRHTRPALSLFSEREYQSWLGLLDAAGVREAAEYFETGLDPLPLLLGEVDLPVLRSELEPRSAGGGGARFGLRGRGVWLGPGPAACRARAGSGTRRASRDVQERALRA